VRLGQIAMHGQAAEGTQLELFDSLRS